MTKHCRTFALGILVGIALTYGTALVAQAGLGSAAGAGDAIRAVNDQHFRERLLQIQPEVGAMNPYGPRFHEVVYVQATTPAAVELVTYEGHATCQTTTLTGALDRSGDDLVRWLGQHRAQFIDVQFAPR
jgi:hypothetical protein